MHTCMYACICICMYRGMYGHRPVKLSYVSMWGNCGSWHACMHKCVHACQIHKLTQFYRTPSQAKGRAAVGCARSCHTRMQTFCSYRRACSTSAIPDELRRLAQLPAASQWLNCTGHGRVMREGPGRRTFALRQPKLHGVGQQWHSGPGPRLGNL